MQVLITALYAGILAIYAIWLSSRAGLMRKGLHHDKIRHPLRAVGAAGTALITVVAGVAAIWTGVDTLFL